MRANKRLTIHFRSDSDALGRQAFEYEDEFIWEFGINIGSLAICDCELSDGSIGGQNSMFSEQRDALYYDVVIKFAFEEC